MRVRKIAKQLKMFHKNLVWDEETMDCVPKYKIANHGAKVAHIIRMTRRHYIKLAKKCGVGTIMYGYYMHRAYSCYIYEDILRCWGYELCE